MEKLELIHVPTGGCSIVGFSGEIWGGMLLLSESGLGFSKKNSVLQGG